MRNISIPASDEYRTAASMGVKSLYRFRSVNLSDQRKLDQLREIFVDCLLYFSKPSQLNDPFECRPLVTVPTVKTEKDQYWVARKLRERFGRHRWSGVSKTESFMRSHVAANNSHLQQFAVEMTNEMPRQLEAYRLCSFSAKSTSPVTWSHYADEHKGICIEFDAANGDFGSAQPVIYSDKLPELGFFETNPDAIARALILTKAEGWKYEEEFRLITRHSPRGIMFRLRNQKFKFDPGHMKSVIFGLNISADQENAVRTMISESPCKPALYRATLSRDKYEVTHVPA